MCVMWREWIEWIEWREWREWREWFDSFLLPTKWYLVMVYHPMCSHHPRIDIPLYLVVHIVVLLDSLSTSRSNVTYYDDDDGRNEISTIKRTIAKHAVVLLVLTFSHLLRIVCHCNLLPYDTPSRDTDSEWKRKCVHGPIQFLVLGEGQR